MSRSRCGDLRRARARLGQAGGGDGVVIAADGDQGVTDTDVPYIEAEGSGLVVDRPATGGQARAVRVRARPVQGGGLPLAVAGPGEVDDPAQPLHAMLALMIVPELHVSPVKIAAALRRMSRSSSDARTRLHSSAFSSPDNPTARTRRWRRGPGAASVLEPDPAAQRLGLDPQIVGYRSDRHAGDR